MQFVGDIGHGRMGPLTKEQAFEWLKAKDTRSYSKGGKDPLSNKLKSCISNIEAMSGSTTSGGGSTRYTFMGAPTNHVSNGVGKGKGVTLFFVSGRATSPRSSPSGITSGRRRTI